MSDNPSPDNPPSDPLADAAASGDVDALLAAAIKLTSELSENLGAGPLPEYVPPPKTDAQEKDPNDEGVESQLDEIDSLLNEACRELGSDDDPPEDAEAASPNTADATLAAAGEGVAPAGDTRAAPKAKAPGHPLMDDPGSLEELGCLDDIPDFGEEPDTVTQTPSASDESNLGADQLVAASLDGGTITAAAKHQWLWSACNKSVGLLDILDKPFGRIGYANRILIGWVAIVTLFASACVLVISTAS